MKAVAFSQAGGPEALHVADLPIPEPGAGEVRIKVAAATVNPTDLGLRSPARVEALKSFAPPYVPGMEAAGTVDAVPAGSTFHPGDRVLAIVLPNAGGRGAQAEYIVVPQESVSRVPEGMTLEQAATIPMNGLTAQQALDKLALKAGQTLAVTGAAGAVGGYGIQLGAAAGLRVIAVSAAGDEALARELGATEFVPRSADVAADLRRLHPEGVDGILDAAVIGRPLLAAIKDGGGIACVRAMEGESERGIAVHRVAVSDYFKNTAALEKLVQMAKDGHLTLRVAETFPPERAAEAQRKLAAGGVRGRLLIRFD
ncbi:MAG: NADP-dependent oxidoreductase [Chloroflexi bacterium]|nr:NADP-dependent oxidoreductase [Chloroflexota bacterium]